MLDHQHQHGGDHDPDLYNTPARHTKPEDFDITPEERHFRTHQAVSRYLRTTRTFFSAQEYADEMAQLVLSQLELLDLTTLPETFGPKDLDPTIRFFEYVEAHLPNEKGWKLDWDKVAVSAEEKEWWGGFLKSWREAKAGDPHQRLKGGAVVMKDCSVHSCREFVLTRRAILAAPVISRKNRSITPTHLSEIFKAEGRPKFLPKIRIPVSPVSPQEADIDDILYAPNKTDRADPSCARLPFPEELVIAARDFRNRQIKMLDSKRRDQAKRRPGHEDLWERWKQEDALKILSSDGMVATPVFAASRPNIISLTPISYSEVVRYPIKAAIQESRLDAERIARTTDAALQPYSVISLLNRMNIDSLESEDYFTKEAFSLEVLDRFEEIPFEPLTPSSKYSSTPQSARSSRSRMSKGKEMTIKSCLTPSGKHHIAPWRDSRPDPVVPSVRHSHLMDIMRTPTRIMGNMAPFPISSSDYQSSGSRGHYPQANNEWPSPADEGVVWRLPQKIRRQGQHVDLGGGSGDIDHAVNSRPVQRALSYAVQAQRLLNSDSVNIPPLPRVKQEQLSVSYQAVDVHGRPLRSILKPTTIDEAAAEDHWQAVPIDDIAQFTSEEEVEAMLSPVRNQLDAAHDQLDYVYDASKTTPLHAVKRRHQAMQPSPLASYELAPYRYQENADPRTISRRPAIRPNDRQIDQATGGHKQANPVAYSPQSAALRSFPGPNEYYGSEEEGFGRERAHPRFPGYRQNQDDLLVDDRGMKVYPKDTRHQEITYEADRSRGSRRMHRNHPQNTVTSFQNGPRYTDHLKQGPSYSISRTGHDESLEDGQLGIEPMSRAYPQHSSGSQMEFEGWDNHGGLPHDALGNNLATGLGDEWDSQTHGPVGEAHVSRTLAPASLPHSGWGAKGSTQAHSMSSAIHQDRTSSHNSQSARPSFPTHHTNSAVPQIITNYRFPDRRTHSTMPSVPKLPIPSSFEAASARDNPTQDELGSMSQPVKRKRPAHTAQTQGVSLEDIVKAKAAKLGIEPSSEPSSLNDPKKAARDFFRLQNVAVPDEPSPLKKQSTSKATSRPAEAKPIKVKAKPDWKSHAAFKNPSWHDQAVGRTISGSLPKIPVLATIDLVRNRPIARALKDHFNLVERIHPQQGVDLVLSATTGVTFFKIQEVQSQRDNMVETLKISCSHYRHTIVVFTADSTLSIGGATSGEVDEIDEDPFPTAINAIPTLKRSVAGLVLPSAKDSGAKVDYLFALDGMQDVVKVLRVKLEEDFITLRSLIGDDAATVVCEERQWLDKDESEESLNLVRGYSLNAFSATYMLAVVPDFHDLAFEMSDQDRIDRFGPVLGQTTINRFNKTLRETLQAYDLSASKSSPQSSAHTSEASPKSTSVRM